MIRAFTAIKRGLVFIFEALAVGTTRGRRRALVLLTRPLAERACIAAPAFWVASCNSSPHHDVGVDETSDIGVSTSARSTDNTGNVPTTTTREPTTTGQTTSAGVPSTGTTGTDKTTALVDGQTNASAPESTLVSPSTNGTSKETNQTANPCDNPNLTWRTGHKTNYESYPDPDSEECIEYNGCYWAGMFAACEEKKPEVWVEAHNIVALFPHFDDLALHDVCIRSGNTTMVVTVFDTCGDNDCDGCCTENRGSADALIDLEKYTNERWGLPDGDVEWADLGPTQSDGCD